MQSEGFLSGTLVKTPSGYSYIEKLKPGDKIISFNLSDNTTPDTSTITNAINYQSDSCVKITIGDSILCCAPDQKFYSHNQQEWVRADKLTYIDLLLDDNNKSIAVNSIEIIQQPCSFDALSLNTNHTYCVSRHNIIAHNTGPVMILYLPVIISTVTPIVKTFFAAATTFFSVHFAKKIKHKLQTSSMTSSSSSTSGSYYPDPNNPNDDKNKTDDRGHPHGVYRDAGYHHKNSTNGKSPSPENGQHCLDYSLPSKTNQRVAIEGDRFVVLRPTCPGEYHGFKVSWKDLHQSLRQILIDHKHVKKSGKIIIQITEKHLK